MEQRKVFDELPTARTPGGGAHVFWRLKQSDNDRGRHLARLRNIDDPKKPDLLVETRAQGNYVVLAGSPASCHPSGKCYEMLHGDFQKNPCGYFKQVADTTAIIAAAESLMRCQKTRRYCKTARLAQRSKELTWAEVLEPHGFTLVREVDGESYCRSRTPRMRHHLTTSHLASEQQTQMLFDELPAIRERQAQGFVSASMGGADSQRRHSSGAQADPIAGFSSLNAAV